MYYFQKHRLGFLHIPKTGGTSFFRFLNKAMQGRGDPELEITRDLYHEPIAAKKEVLGTDLFAQSRFISLIRNPYATVVSLYFWCRRKVAENHPDLHLYPSVREVAAMGFREYLDWYMENEQPFEHYLLLDGGLPENLTVIRLEEVHADADRILNGELGLGIDIRIGTTGSRSFHAPALSYLTLSDIDRINAKYDWAFRTYYTACKLGQDGRRQLHACCLNMLAACAAAGDNSMAAANDLNDALLTGRSPFAAMAACLAESCQGEDQELVLRLVASVLRCWTADRDLAQALFRAITHVAATMQGEDHREMIGGVVERLAVESLLPDCPPQFAALALWGLAKPAVRTNSIDAMRLLCRRWAPTRTKGLPHVLSMLKALWKRGLADDIAGLVDAVADRDKAMPGAVRLRVSIALRRKENLAPLRCLADAMDRSAPDYEETRQWIEQALGGAGSGSDRAPAGLPLRMTVADCGPLAPVLEPLLPSVNATLRHDAWPEISDIEAARDAVLQGRQEAAAAGAPWETIKVMTGLCAMAELSFRGLAFTAECAPFRWSPSYGTLDIYRYKAVHDACMEIVRAFAIDTLHGLKHVRADEPPIRRYAIVLLGAAAVRLGNCEAAVPVIENILAGGAWEAAPEEWLALERCYLALSDVAGARRTRERGRLGGGSVHQVRAFSEWAVAEGLESRVLFDDGAESGAFDYVREETGLIRHHHEVPRCAMYAAAVEGFTMRGPHLIIGPGATVLKPGSYVQVGEFPYPEPAILNRVTGDRVAVTLSEMMERSEEEVPVVVLDHTVTHVNYYHWMLEFVSRALWARAHGLTAGRKLVVPKGLTGWMTEALSLARFAADDLHAVASGRATGFRDALLISCTDFASRSLFDTMRRHFWEVAGVPQPVAGRNGRLLFLSRDREDYRSLRNRVEIELLAQEMGFEVLFPERFSIAEQVRIFASAAGIAGLEGAGFTNQIFAPDGIRILGISKEEDNEPTFINLSVLARQDRRIVGGKTPPRHLIHKPFMSPYRVDPGLVREGLSWVKEGVA